MRDREKCVGIPLERLNKNNFFFNTLKKKEVLGRGEGKTQLNSIINRRSLLYLFAGCMVRNRARHFSFAKWEAKLTVTYLGRVSTVIRFPGTYKERLIQSQQHLTRILYTLLPTNKYLVYTKKSVLVFCSCKVPCLKNIFTFTTESNERLLCPVLSPALLILDIIRYLPTIIWTFPGRKYESASIAIDLSNRED